MNKTNLKNVKKMVSDVKKKQHPEYGMTKVKGISLSRSDIDTMELITEQIVLNQGEYPSYLGPVYGDLRELFISYNLPYKSEW